MTACIKRYQTEGDGEMRLTVKKKNYFGATQVAANLGISKQTLLRYEARGVFPKARRNQLNRWREYTEGDIETLRKIMGR